HLHERRLHRRRAAAAPLARGAGVRRARLPQGGDGRLGDVAPTRSLHHHPRGRQQADPRARLRHPLRVDVAGVAPRDRAPHRPHRARLVQRYPLIFTQRRVLPLAVLVAGVGAAVAEVLWARLTCAAVALLALVAAFFQWRARPTLIIDDQGYAVEE